MEGGCHATIFPAAAGRCRLAGSCLSLGACNPQIGVRRCGRESLAFQRIVTTLSLGDARNGGEEGRRSIKCYFVRQPSKMPQCDCYRAGAVRAQEYGPSRWIGQVKPGWASTGQRSFQRNGFTRFGKRFWIYQLCVSMFPASWGMPPFPQQLTDLPFPQNTSCTYH